MQLIRPEIRADVTTVEVETETSDIAAITDLAAWIETR
jgi:hypothetical protein